MSDLILSSSWSVIASVVRRLDPPPRELTPAEQTRCARCAVAFETTRWRARYCSVSCSNTHRFELSLEGRAARTAAARMRRRASENARRAAIRAARP